MFHKPWLYDFRFLRYWLELMDFFFVRLVQFCHFLLIKACKIKSEKWKKQLEILFYTCVTKIMIWLRYGSWDTERDKQIFVILGHFMLFYGRPPPPPSPSLLHNPENHHSYVPKILIIWPTVLGICSMKDWNWQFWVVFCPLGPLTTQKIKLLKKWKNRLELLSFYTCVT